MDDGVVGVLGGEAAAAGRAADGPVLGALLAGLVDERKVGLVARLVAVDDARLTRALLHVVIDTPRGGPLRRAGS